MRTYRGEIGCAPDNPWRTRRSRSAGASVSPRWLIASVVKQAELFRTGLSATDRGGGRFRFDGR